MNAHPPRQDGLGFYPPLNGDDRCFDDRRDAGRQLAQALGRYALADPVVLGIPRGGMEVAAEVARALDAELDVLVTKKVGVPGHEELAIGAVTADGSVHLNPRVVGLLGMGEADLENAVRQRRAEAEAREVRLRRSRPSVSLAGRTVILVDDGAATGATLFAAARAAGTRGAHPLVIAVPVGAPSTVRALRAVVDDVVCLAEPDPFYAVGAHYRSFDQGSEEEVERLLAAARDRRAPHMGRGATDPWSE